MRHWIASVEDDYGRMQVALRLGYRVGEDRVSVAVATGDDGTLVMQEQGTYDVTPAVLRLPREAVEALRDALNGHMPPTDDGDLRDALKVERERVDRMLDAALNR